MKVLRILMGLIMVLGLTVGNAKGEALETSKLNLPKTQAGMVYSVEEEEFKACTTLTLLSYPTKVGEVELRGGYVVDKEPIGALCFKVGDLTQYGIKMPLHHLINVSLGGYVGYMIEEKEVDYGLIVTLIEIKF